MNRRFFWVLILSLFVISCDNPQSKNNEPRPSEANSQSPPDSRPAEPISIPQSNSYSRDGNNDCGISDGTYNSVVDYYNPKTGYSSTYTLDVVVDNCEVTEIDFPKGGWLDSDHIDPTEINDDGTAEVVDDQGRSFEVHIEKDNIDT